LFIFRAEFIVNIFHVILNASMKFILFLTLFFAVFNVLTGAAPAPVPAPKPVPAPVPVPVPAPGRKCGLFHKGIFCPFTFCGFFGRLIFGSKNC
jgi:hypothetical protein